MEFWIMIAIISIIVEVLTINLVSIWLCIGAVIAGISSVFIDNFTIQCVIFIISSAISLILTRPIAKRIKNKGIVKTNLDRVVGQIGVITEGVRPYSIGEVKVDGKRWSCYSDKEIGIGSKVEILSIDGVKLKVKEMEEV